MQSNKSAVEYAVISMPINEEFYERTIIEHLRDDLGYEFLHGPDVLRTTAEYHDVFLPTVLPASLKRINPDLPSVAIDQAILKISNIEASFCATVGIEDITGQNYIPTPGRYVGIKEEADDGEPFEEKMARLTGELAKCFEESDRLQEQIKKNLEAIGYGF